MKMKKILLIFIIIYSVIFTAHAQSKDRRQAEIITIPVVHPPSLGMKVNKIAFGPASGVCSDQIIDAIKSDFVSNNIEVVDRENLNAILAEHSFTFSGYIDQSSASTIGKILGPSALIFIKVQRCVTQIDHLTDKVVRFKPDYTKYYVPKYISRTRAFLKGSIQAVDLTTGKIFTAQVFDYSPQKQNESFDGIPEAPSEYDIQDIAFRQLVDDVHKLFLPWTENMYQYYFDDKKYNIRDAYNSIKSGMIDWALDFSIKSLDACKNDPKAEPRILAHAYYNLGISYLTKLEYDKAIECLNESGKLNPGDVVNSAINSCNKAKNLMLELQKVEEKASIELQKNQETSEKALQIENTSILSNDDIIELTKKKLPNSLIIKKIETSKCQFDTSTDALINLTNSGVSEEVVMIMMEKK